MPIDIIVPRLGWSMEEGAFVAWLKPDGAFVQAGEPLFSIEGDKAIQEIESLDSGFLRIAPNAPKPGGSLRVGDVLGQLVLAEEVAPAFSPVPPPDKPAALSPNEPPAVPRVPPPHEPARGLDSPAPCGTATQPSARIPKHSGPILTPGTRPMISPRARRVASDLGIDWTQVTGTGRTGRIRERDVQSFADAIPKASANLTDRQRTTP